MTARDRQSWWQQWRESRRQRRDLYAELTRMQGRADMWRTRAHTLERQRDAARAETDAAVQAVGHLSARQARIQMLLGDGDRTAEERLDRIAQVFMQVDPPAQASPEEWVPYGG